LNETVDVLGSLAPKFSVDVKSEVSGVVTAVYVTEWVPVHKGDRLARLDTSETEAGLEALKAGVAQAQVAEARARREYERAQQLRQYGLITPQNFDDAKTAVDAAAAATSAAQAQVRTLEARLAKSFITSPMDGVVALRGVSVGDRVENMGGSDPMFRIVDNRLLDLTVSVPSSQIASVGVGQPLEFSTDALPGRTFTGKVMFINPAIDETSRSARVVAEVPNRDGVLKGGAFVKGRILVSTRRGVLQVPREALLNWSVEQQTADVFVVRNGRAEKRTVKVGTANGVAVEVVSGVAPGEQVVTRGGFALRPGDRVTVATGEGV
jgi:RND family efflux transporter MFP subunit